MTLNCRTRSTIFLCVNLTSYQGVNPRQHWVSGVFWGFGCSGGADPPGIRLPCFGRYLWGKCLINNNLSLVLASPGSGDCRFSLFFYVVPPCPVPPLDSEKVAIGEALWPEVERAAKEKQKQSLGRGKKVRQITEPFKKGDTRERVAKVVGWSGQTYGRAKDVVEVSECEFSFYAVRPVRSPTVRRLFISEW